MKHYTDVVLDSNGHPVSGASIQVLGHVSQTNSTIYSDDGSTTTANPTFADSLGRFGFWVADGTYDLEVTSGTTSYTLASIEIADVLERASTDTAWASLKLAGATSGSIIVLPTAIAGSNTLTLPAATDTLVGKATTDTLTNKTLTAPVLNGSPTGTGIQTLTLKKGTGSGNYTSASTSYVDVDATNLGYTVTIPTGWKLFISTSGSIQVLTAAVTIAVALFDTAVILEQTIVPAAASALNPFSLEWVITGDGNSHTVKLQFKTTNASDSVSIQNSTATALPTMTFLLTPSN